MARGSKKRGRKLLLAAILSAAMMLSNVLPGFGRTESNIAQVSAAEMVTSAYVENGEYYLTAGANGMVVCAENTGADPLTANRTSYGGAWEALTIVNNSDGTISLKSGANDKYVCAVIDESNQLLARSSVIDAWEKFYLIKVNDTQYALQAVANGLYVKADINEGQGGVLKADSSQIQAWECFNLYRTGSTDSGSTGGNTGSGSSGSTMDDFKIIGYAPNWYGTGYLDTINYSQLTHLIYAFAIPTADGRILDLNDGGFMTALVNKAHANGVKVGIAIGGWSYNGVALEATFAEATNTDAKCKTLADAMLAVVDQYNLDGIDVDWEYPRDNTSWQYETLIKYLRQGLDARGGDKFLSSAVAGTASNGYSSTALNMLDMVNIMAYDGDSGSGHSPYSYAVNSTNSWKNAGVPAEKLMVGVPFYERPNWAPYKDIVAANVNNAYSDSAYINGTTVYYNGLNTIAEKTKFACENAGGVMIWEMSQDYTADKNLSLLNKIYETAKANLPTSGSTGNTNQGSGTTTGGSTSGSVNSGSSNSASTGSIVANGEYYLVDSQGMVVCAENTGSDPLVANRSSYGGAWETITIENNSDGTVSLKSGANGLYVCAVIDESNQLLARSSAIDTWEKFYLERLSNGNFALKAVANGKYVCADQNKSSVLYADRDSAGGWENFKIYTTGGSAVQ